MLPQCGPRFPANHIPTQSTDRPSCQSWCLATFWRPNNNCLKKERERKKKTWQSTQAWVFGRPMSCVILLSGRSLRTMQLPIIGTRFFASLLRSCHVIHSGIWMCGCDTIICFCSLTIGEKCVSSYVGWNVLVLKMLFSRNLAKLWSVVTNGTVYSDMKSVNMSLLWF